MRLVAWSHDFVNEFVVSLRFMNQIAGNRQRFCASEHQIHGVDQEVSRLNPNNHSRSVIDLELRLADRGFDHDLVSAANVGDVNTGVRLQLTCQP